MPIGPGTIGQRSSIQPEIYTPFRCQVAVADVGLLQANCTKVAATVQLGFSWDKPSHIRVVGEVDAFAGVVDGGCLRILLICWLQAAGVVIVERAYDGLISRQPMPRFRRLVRARRVYPLSEVCEPPKDSLKCVRVEQS